VDFFKVRLSRHLASSCNHFLTPALGDYVPLKRLFTEGRVAHGRRSITGLKSVHVRFPNQKNCNWPRAP
jgi:hypothetical protein